MGYECIEIKEGYAGQTIEVILKPKPANILTARMMDEISLCIAEGEEVKSRKAIIFSGEGEHFGFGASVAEHRAGEVGAMLPKFHKFIGQILACRVPTIAKVVGKCLGGAFELALACTFIFADRNAQFAVPEIRLGVFPPPACLLLPFRGGDALASQLILTGEAQGAPALHARGIVNAVSEEGKLDSDVRQFVEKGLLPKSASSLKIAARASRMALAGFYEQWIGALERLYLDELMSTKDASLGIESFLAKKAPDWLNE